MQSGNLNFLEFSGPLQACNGTALPLPSTVIKVVVPHSDNVSKVVEPCVNTVSNDCLFVTFIIAILSFLCTS